MRVTHDFLTEDDIARLRPLVAKALQAIPVLAVARTGNETSGFAGDNIEMLFVAPAHIGRGVGRGLLSWAKSVHGCRRIDVNEQNAHALAVYQHWGFRVCGRSETDDQGNPFPVLRMELDV